MRSRSRAGSRARGRRCNGLSPCPSLPAPTPLPTDRLQAAPGAEAAAAAAGCGLREPGLDAPLTPVPQELYLVEEGLGVPMEVRGGETCPPPHPPGLKEGLEVTGEDGQGPGGGQAWRMATGRRG